MTVNLDIDQVLAEVGRLHLINQSLSRQLAELRQKLLAAAQPASPAENPPESQEKDEP